MGILDWLRLAEAHTLTDLDDPATSRLHARIIREKPFLRRLYLEWYRILGDAIAKEAPDRVVVEIGSGGGFVKEVIPDATTSDVLNLTNVDLRFSAINMPFAESSVDAIVMIDVLHHIPDTAAFLRELDRCLKVGGKAVMVEPANTPWGRFIYQHFHHEPFVPSAGWQVKGNGPLSSANGAIPWIVFCRDRAKFEREFPNLRLQRLCPHTPLRYLLSGGVSMRQLVPSCSFRLFTILERLASPFNPLMGMFYTIEIHKTTTPSQRPAALCRGSTPIPTLPGH